MNKKGFTLVELLVVIAVIAMISSIAVIGLNRARDSSIATRTINDLRQIEKALTTLVSETNAPAWWNDDTFGSEDPLLTAVTGLTTYLPKIPECQLPGSDGYRYDNDGDQLLTPSNDMNGVNIIMDMSSTTQAVRDKFFNMMDEGGDYGSGDDAGKIRTNGTDTIFFNITPIESEW